MFPVSLDMRVRDNVFCSAGVNPGRIATTSPNVELTATAGMEELLLGWRSVRRDHFEKLLAWAVLITRRVLCDRVMMAVMANVVISNDSNSVRNVLGVADDHRCCRRFFMALNSFLKKSTFGSRK